MFKVGLYGVENSHANAFCKEFRDNPAYADFKVTSVGGIYPESVAKLSETYGADIENDPEEMAKKVDCAMITCRDGKYHLAAALPFIRRKLPIFLDKPLTVTEADCETLAREVKQYGKLFVGGSSVKIADDVEELLRLKEDKTVLAGSITCPISLENPYGGFFFYSAHLAETLLRVFGYEPKTVEVHSMPGGLHGTVYYENFPVHFTYLQEVYDYAIEVDTSKGIFQKHLDLSCIFKKETEAFSRLVRYGETDFSVYELTKSVYVLSAMYRSLENGKPEPIGSLPKELL